MSKKMDPIAIAILAALDAALSEKETDLSATEIAQMIADTKRTPKDPADLWRKYLSAVKQQALFLSREGLILMIRKGEIVSEIEKVKGLIKYRGIAD